MIIINKELVYSQCDCIENHSLKLRWKELLSDWRYHFILACSEAFTELSCVMEAQHNYGIELEHPIILLALMPCNTLVSDLPMEFANKVSNCVIFSCGVETLISSFCASLQTPIMHYQCLKQDLVCGCSYMQKSPSSTEGRQTILREIQRL